jgi:hypothetical protein
VAARRELGRVLPTARRRTAPLRSLSHVRKGIRVGAFRDRNIFFIISVDFVVLFSMVD